MRKLHLVELVTALNGAEEVFDRVSHLHDISHVMLEGPNVYTVFFQVFDQGQAFLALSVIDLSSGLPVLLELIV